LVLSFSSELISPDLENLIRGQQVQNRNIDEEFNKLRLAFLAFSKRISAIDIDISVNGTQLWAYRVQAPFSGVDIANIKQGSVQLTFSDLNPVADVKGAYEKINSEQETQDRRPRSLLRPL
jgi:hypothetical protein